MEFLNYHHLRYFWTVAREGGLRKAAAKLHVSQPTISAQVQALERELGEKLFWRSGRSLALTNIGQQVLSLADEIFALGEDLLKSVKQRPTARPLRVNLGVANALPKFVTYSIIEPLFRLPVPVQVACWGTSVSEMLFKLAAYQLDVVLADEPASTGVASDVFNYLLGSSGITFCATAKMAAKLRRGFPKSLTDAPALLPTSDTGLRRSLEKWFYTVGVRPRLVGELYDPAFVTVLGLQGLGFMPVPTIVVQEAVGRFGFRIIGQTDECQQRYYAITSKRKLGHPAVTAITLNKRLFNQ